MGLTTMNSDGCSLHNVLGALDLNDRQTVPHHFLAAYLMIRGGKMAVVS